MIDLIPDAKDERFQISVEQILTLALSELPNRTLTFSALPVPVKEGRVEITYNRDRFEYQIRFVPADSEDVQALEVGLGSMGQCEKGSQFPGPM